MKTQWLLFSGDYTLTKKYLWISYSISASWSNWTLQTVSLIDQVILGQKCVIFPCLLFGCQALLLFSVTWNNQINKFHFLTVSRAKKKTFDYHLIEMGMAAVFWHIIDQTIDELTNKKRQWWNIGFYSQTKWETTTWSRCEKS